MHRDILEDNSVYFRDVFARNVGRGDADSHPIQLWRVTRGHFEILLRYLYFG